MPPPVVFLAGRHLMVQRVAQPAIKAGAIRPMEEHREVVRMLPVTLGPEIGADVLVELGPRQRIRHRDAYLIGALLANEIASQQDVRPGLRRIPELDEPARPNP